MILLPKSFFAILLASSFLFNRAQAIRELLGYITVTPEEAMNINSFRTLSGFGLQKQGMIGEGIYFRLEIEAWGWDEVGPRWYCVADAHRGKMDKVEKVYIPELWPKPIENGVYLMTALWNRGEDAIREFILNLFDRRKNPDKVIRFSRIPNFGWDMQMLIPTYYLQNEELGIKSTCFETREALKDYSNKPADWSRWISTENPGDLDINTQDLPEHP
ncbi:uncharacterized protein L3040_006613 [Drepanopeziza brunnea f. sp. 'multigermtubi']|uniref:uncharacterized protein n=1 Tax=Drepanopeziza brunnea f. sp. 'multigermtubi' TaxID=698441 RepID=UPI0023A304DC|nr:hypothetical protein L3040_006613 [Drepanopeziza brunnea f. sp. 'multigermtubi']